MKPLYPRLVLIGFLTAGVAAIFQNCSRAEFTDPTLLYDLDGTASTSGVDPSGTTDPNGTGGTGTGGTGGTGTGTGGPGTGTGGPGTPGGTLTVVCDPFNPANIIDPKLGIEGRIYSAGRRLSANECVSSPCTSRDYIAKGTKTNAQLFLSRLFVPTRDFTQGFGLEGGAKVVDTNNNTLFEWFALDLASSLQLGAADSEGMYQLAIISDDGATLSQGNENIIVHEGEHPPSLKCSQRVIPLKKGDAFPFRLSYFQGPRTQIALVLLWRKVMPGQDLTHCGSSDGYISDANNLPEGLKSKGWKVVKPENLLLQKGSNKCSKP